MDPRALYPTCVLKANLDCCKACVVNLKKLLSKIDGVYAVGIDAEKGLVTVSGKVDPAILIKKIAKKRKKAEVLSYEEPTMNAQNKNSKNINDKKNGHQHKGKDKGCFYSDDFDHEFEDYLPPKVFEDIECRDCHCRLHHKKPIIHSNVYVPMVKLQPPPTRQRYLPPPNQHYPIVYDRPLPQYDHCSCRRPPPQPPHYGYY